MACTLRFFHTWNCYTCLIVGWRVWQRQVDAVPLPGAEWPPLFQWKLRRDLPPTLRMQTPTQKNPGNQRSCSRAADAQVSTLNSICIKQIYMGLKLTYLRSSFQHWNVSKLKINKVLVASSCTIWFFFSQDLLCSFTILRCLLFLSLFSLTKPALHSELHFLSAFHLRSSLHVTQITSQWFFIFSRSSYILGH